MALFIEKPNPTSASMMTSHWRAARVSVTPGQGVNVTMEGYWTAADRDAGKCLADRREVMLPPPPEEGLTMQWVYQQIKLHPDFAGAQDA